MKKIKLLMPLLGTATIATAIVPMVSCGGSKEEVEISDTEKNQTSVGGVAVFTMEVDDSYVTDDFETELTGENKDDLEVAYQEVVEGKLNIAIEEKTQSNGKGRSFKFGIKVKNKKDKWEKQIDDLTITEQDVTGESESKSDDLSFTPKASADKISEWATNEEKAWTYYKQGHDINTIATMFADDIAYYAYVGLFSFLGEKQAHCVANVTNIDLEKRIVSYNFDVTITENGKTSLFMKMVVNNVRYSIIPNPFYSMNGAAYDTWSPTVLGSLKFNSDDKWNMYYECAGLPIGLAAQKLVINQESSESAIQSFKEKGAARPSTSTYVAQVGVAKAYWLIPNGK